MGHTESRCTSSLGGVLGKDPLNFVAQVCCQVRRICSGSCDIIYSTQMYMYVYVYVGYYIYIYRVRKLSYAPVQKW